jgi:hypothetical protein
MMTPLTTPSPFLIDEIVLVDLLALFLSVVTVSILWYVVKKIYHLPRTGRHKLRCDGWTVWLAADLAVKRTIVATDFRCSSFLYRANGLAMVGLA